MRIDLVLVGFGSVARAFVQLLGERGDALRRGHDLKPRIVGISTARHGAAHAPSGLDPTRALRLLGEGASLDTLHALGPPLTGSADLIARATAQAGGAPAVVVETTPLSLDGAQAAIEHVRTALRSGLHVVSANKGPVAFAYHELSELAARMRVRYLFEGAVMDGIPVFSLLREAMPAIGVTGFRGVVNSTTNFILSSLEEGGEFESSLAEMQRQGIAEADASLDVDGWDAAAKAAALANVWMGARLTPREVERTGVRHISGEMARAALARGRRVRLVASAARQGERVRVRVEPEELAMDDPLALLRGMGNALFVETDLLGRVGITQLDGGLTQTAYALLADLITVRRAL